MEIINIKGVDCYEQDGTAYLNLENVARGLGFTQEKNGVEYVRWETINGYLDHLGFPNKLGKDDYIPENIFYRLAMKAKNETAEKFQALIADEVIPAIRKHGGYLVGNMSPTQILRLQLEAMERIEQEQKQQNEVLCMQSKRLHDVAHKVDTMGELLTLNPEEWRGNSRKVVAKIAKKLGGFEQMEDVYVLIYRVMLDRFCVDVNKRLKAKKRRAEKAGVAKSTIDGWSRLDAVAEDKRAIEAYLQVVREMAIKFGVDIEEEENEKGN